MGTISLQVPLVGQPNSTEDPKISSDFTTLQTWANGNVDDSNLASPSNAVRRLLLQATGRIASSAPAGDYLIVPSGLLAGGAIVAGEPPLWVGDSGLSGQPQDWQVAGKSAYCRVRVTIATNTASPGITVAGKLFQITSVGGTSANIALTFVALAGAATPALTPGVIVVSAAESPQFAMPLSGAYALGVTLNATPAAASQMIVSAQLYGYNA